MKLVKGSGDVEHDSVFFDISDYTIHHGSLRKAKSAENSRLIVALSAMGKDAASVGDWDLARNPCWKSWTESRSSTAWWSDSNS